MSDKFCVNCKHCTDVFGSQHSCISPEISKDLVTGRSLSLTCLAARYDEHLCGREAKWFEPKETAKDESK